MTPPSDDRIDGRDPDRSDDVPTWRSGDDHIEFGSERTPRAASAYRWAMGVVRGGGGAIASTTLAVVAVVGLVVAIVGRLPIADQIAPPPQSSARVNLNQEQAACFAFALAERRVALVLGSQSPIGVGPEAKAMRAEIEALDAVATSYPYADYRLISVFADVANESVRVLGVRGKPAADDMAADRYDALRTATNVCSRVARFDVDGMQPIPAG
jgi:hypothetical protein